MENQPNDNRLQFKAFVKQHPELITDMKKHDHTWKDLYEAYQLFGDEADIWNLYHSPEKKKSSDLKGTIKKVTDYFQEMDGESIKQHLTLVDGLLTDLQGFLSPKKDQEKVETSPNSQNPPPQQPYYNRPQYYSSWYGPPVQPPRRP